VSPNTTTTGAASSPGVWRRSRATTQGSERVRALDRCRGRFGRGCGEGPGVVAVSSVGGTGPNAGSAAIWSKSGAGRLRWGQIRPAQWGQIKLSFPLSARSRGVGAPAEGSAGSAMRTVQRIFPAPPLRVTGHERGLRTSGAALGGAEKIVRTAVPAAATPAPQATTGSAIGWWARWASPTTTRWPSRSSACSRPN
jgi:hypothetical protein